MMNSRFDEVNNSNFVVLLKLMNSSRHLVELLSEHTPKVTKSHGSDKVWTVYKGKWSPYAVPQQDG